MKRGIFSILFLSLIIGQAAPLKIDGLKVEFQTNPSSVSSTPRLSWKLESEERGKRQSQYHIIAASSADGLTPETADLWNSNLKKGAFKHLVAWAGKPLKEGQTVHWKVKVHDEKGTASDWSAPATFTVGTKRELQKPARTSTFESSSEALNLLYQESLKKLEAQIAKTEKGGLAELGTGFEVQRSARAILYHFDALAHLSEWIHQMDKSRTEEGFFPIRPSSKSVGALSSESGITVNHPVWWMGGDHALVKKRWTHFEKHMIARENADKAFKGTTWGDLKASEGVPPEFLDLCYLGFTTRLTRELALPAQQPLNVIRFQDYAARIQKSFEKQYLDEDGSLKVSSQTAHLLALRCGVLKKENQRKIIDAFHASIEKEGLKIGPIGAYFLPSVLSLTNKHDKAIDLLTQLNQEQKQNFIGNGISEWCMSFLGGIDASTAGFTNIRIVPRIPSNDSLKWVKASYDSVAGTIKVHWERQNDGGLKVDFSIPPGSFARIVLPCQKDQTITEGGKHLDDALGIDQASRADTAVSLISQSGSFSILIK